MSDDISESSYWSRQYKTGKTGWNIGSVSQPLKQYFDQLTNKAIRILIPGAGHGWEAQYLFETGFNNVFVLDFAPEAIENFKSRNKYFPDNQLIINDFFQHQGKYDLIVEQTFFCALPRQNRSNYVEKMHQLLKHDGKLAGLLFNHEFESPGPPFGGTKSEYLSLFENYFHIEVFDISSNSIEPRNQREFFFLCRPKPIN